MSTAIVPVIGKDRQRVASRSRIDRIIARSRIDRIIAGDPYSAALVKYSSAHKHGLYNFTALWPLAFWRYGLTPFRAKLFKLYIHTFVCMPE